MDLEGFCVKNRKNLLRNRSPKLLTRSVDRELGQVMDQLIRSLDMDLEDDDPDSDLHVDPVLGHDCGFCRFVTLLR